MITNSRCGSGSGSGCDSDARSGEDESVDTGLAGLGDSETLPGLSVSGGTTAAGLSWSRSRGMAVCVRDGAQPYGRCWWGTRIDCREVRLERRVQARRGRVRGGERKGMEVCSVAEERLAEAGAGRQTGGRDDEKNETRRDETRQETAVGWCCRGGRASATFGRPRSATPGLQPRHRVMCEVQQQQQQKQSGMREERRALAASQHLTVFVGQCKARAREMASSPPT